MNERKNSKPESIIDILDNTTMSWFNGSKVKNGKEIWVLKTES